MEHSGELLIFERWQGLQTSQGPDPSTFSTGLLTGKERGRSLC